MKSISSVYKKVYKENKSLDDLFNERYAYESQYYEKNCIEILTELSEFVNETKCFKYWSVKKPKRDDALEEYADCITMTMYFLHKLNLELDNIPSHIEECDKLRVINYLFLQCTKLYDNISEELVKDIFANMLYLGSLFDLKDEEIIEAIEKKQAKIQDRFSYDY